VEKVILDTNVLIEILKGNAKTIEKIHSFQEISISSITVMELYYGAINKAELKKIEKFITLFNVIDINEVISQTSTTLIKRYAKSHTLDIPDSLIASTALVYEQSLFTYNLKDFRYIENIRLV
jgi:predicted nucleic acid-binding protein